jgi:hypothetical protein
MIHLIKVEETYRADSEKEAAKLINDAKNNNSFTLSKYTSVHRELKQKGEVVDEWQRVTLTKIIDDEREPIGSTVISYDAFGSAFKEEE